MAVPCGAGNGGMGGRRNENNGRRGMSAQYAALGVQVAAAILKWWSERKAAKAKAKAEKEKAAVKP